MSSQQNHRMREDSCTTLRQEKLHCLRRAMRHCKIANAASISVQKMRKALYERLNNDWIVRLNRIVSTLPALKGSTAHNIGCDDNVDVRNG